MAETAKPMQLKRETLEAFEDYIRVAEAQMKQTLRGPRPFLWSDDNPVRGALLRKGAVLAELWPGAGNSAGRKIDGPKKVPDGLIHDWIGAVFVPGRTVQQALALVQDYDNHQVIYQPEVIDSKLLRHKGNHFQVYMRLLKKKIITVVLDTEHDVHYIQLNGTRWFCLSHTTLIAEVEDAGTANEKVSPPDTGYGFLWRLYSYWRFEQRDGGVYIECRAISLTRDIPFALTLIIKPIVRNLPKESLINTLKATRQALSCASAHKA
jgi:hypothetical protein